MNQLLVPQNAINRLPSKKTCRKEFPKLRSNKVLRITFGPKREDVAGENRM